MPYIPYKQFMRKSAVAVLTPETMQVAMQPPPQDPGMMGGQPPMDPSMMGGMMPPGGAPPMDPSMMGGAPMPPQGAPMDPAMMGGQPPMDPSMMGGAPAGGLPPEAMQDPMFIQFLAEAMGIMMDQTSGQFFDQSGQPVPPDVLMQAYQSYMQAMQQMQAGGMPMDPSMMGGQPPMDPAAMGGAPMDPAAMGGAPEEQPMDPMMQELASLMTTVVGDEVVTPLKEAIEAIGKQMNDLKELVKTMRDEMDVVRDQVDSQAQTDDKRTQEDKDEEQKLRDGLAADLQPTVPQEPEVKTAAAQPVQPAEQWRPVNIMDVLGRK